MITYFYWILVLALSGLFIVALVKVERPKAGLIGAVVIFILGVIAYYFHFEQVFVKHYGGVMTISVPKGQQHISATWKDDNLWVENYDPETNICHFNEYSKGNLLQGKVSIKNCNPINTRRVAPPPNQQ